VSSYANKLELTGGGTGMQNVIIGIIGRKGTGKSTLTRAILERGNRESIYDTAGDHLWVPSQFVNIDEAHTFIVDAGLKPEPFICSYIPETEQDEELIQDFQIFCSAVWEAGNQTIVVEELPMLSQPQWVPPQFNKIIRLGRHRAINIVYTGQRASEIPRRATGATDIFILFHTAEPNDLDRISERCGVEVANSVRNLGEHEFIVFDVKARALVQVDEQWYYLVLQPQTTTIWTPAVGRSGRSNFWSLEDNGE
jgi:hypothetical protein